MESQRDTTTRPAIGCPSNRSAPATNPVQDVFRRHGMTRYGKVTGLGQPEVEIVTRKAENDKGKGT